MPSGSASSRTHHVANGRLHVGAAIYHGTDGCRRVSTTSAPRHAYALGGPKYFLAFLATVSGSHTLSALRPSCRASVLGPRSARLARRCSRQRRNTGAFRLPSDTARLHRSGVPRLYGSLAGARKRLTPCWSHAPSAARSATPGPVAPPTTGACGPALRRQRPQRRRRSLHVTDGCPCSSHSQRPLGRVLGRGPMLAFPNERSP